MLIDRRISALLFTIVLTGCGMSDPLAETPETLNRELADANVAGIGDPVLATALQAPLMSDPALSQSANADTIRPPSRPDPDGVPIDDVVPQSSSVSDRMSRPAPPPAPCPDCTAAKAALTPVGLAVAQGDRSITVCATRLRYSAEWANRLPAGIGLYPNAHVVEAAGTDAPGCRLRVIRFASAASVGRLVGWYHAGATADGWSGTYRADGDMHVVSGRRGGGSYAVYMTPRHDGGSDAALVANGG